MVGLFSFQLKMQFIKESFNFIQAKLSINVIKHLWVSNRTFSASQ